jgi:hypothetical protein
MAKVAVEQTTDFGDIDKIVSMGALAADMVHYLLHGPIQAKPPTPGPLTCQPRMQTRVHILWRDIDLPVRQAMPSEIGPGPFLQKGCRWV